jgi:hypothetical protein
MRRAPRGNPDQPALLQDRLGPGVAQVEAVIGPQGFMVSIGGQY